MQFLYALEHDYRVVWPAAANRLPASQFPAIEDFTDPGHVYARLIVSGQTPYPFDNTQGAGRSVLPVNGYSWWGKTSISHREVVEIPLNVTREPEHRAPWQQASGCCE